MDEALGLLAQGLNAVVDMVASAVNDAIKFAESTIATLGVFAKLIVDRHLPEAP